MEPRNYKYGAVETPPQPLENPSFGFPTEGNEAIGLAATAPGTYWHYSISEEMRNVIVAAGLTPDYEDLTQFSQAIQSLIISNLLPVGTVLPMGGDVVPNGFFKRNGAEVSRSTYALHWSYVQTVSNLVDQAVKDASPEIYAGYYGTGDGISTYTLPDSRGEYPRFWDDGRGVDAGRLIGSWQGDAIKAHTHTYSFRATVFEGSTSTPGSGSGGVNTGTTNSTGGSENRVRSTALMAIEKY